MHQRPGRERSTFRIGLGAWVFQRADAVRQFGARRILRGDQFGIVGVHQRAVEHHRVVAGMVEGEPNISERGVDEVRPRGRQGVGQHPPALGGERGEQAAAVGEVVRRGGVRHPGLAGEFAQRDPVGAALGHQGGGLGQDDGLQVAVVIGVPAHATIITRNLDSA